MAAIFEKSRTWRKIVALGKASPAFFWGFTATTLGAAGLLAYVTQKATDRNPDQFREELLKRSRKDAVLVNSANKERLGQLLKEIQQKDNFEDRYKAALNGETLTGTPGARVRGGSGTSATDEWVAKAAEAQRALLEKGGGDTGGVEKIVRGSQKLEKQGVRVARVKESESIKAGSPQPKNQERMVESDRKNAVLPAGARKPEPEVASESKQSWWSWGKSTV